MERPGKPSSGIPSETGLRRGFRRRFCLLLDGRVVSGRSRNHGLGLRVDNPEAQAQAGPDCGFCLLRTHPLSPDVAWPRISVVVCTHNGSRTIGDCCEGLLQLDYPEFEVIVVDDGSTDGAAELVESYGFHAFRTSN